MPPKVRRKEPRKRGLYYHSTPPKVIPANETKQVERRYRNKTQTNNNDVFVVKPSNIRIWIHDKDIAKLTRVLWSGQGFRLLNETSTHGRVRKFLENVPLVLNAVKEIHAAVIENNTEQLQFLLELPPPAIITTKDQNGLTVAHKAAGLGHPEMLDFIVKTWPQGSKEIDKTGKTPLHWSALAKDNQNSMQEMLMQNFGVQEDVMDYKMKTPAYYKTKPQELEKSFLTALPSAPRIQRHQVVDWGLLEDDIGDLNGSRPMDKIVVEKKKKSIEREDHDVDPDLEESAKKTKNHLDESENKNQSDIIEKVVPISKILQNGKIPNGNITNENNNTENLSETPNKENNNNINLLPNGNLIMNGDDLELHESISLEPSPSPLSLSDTPDQTLENTPMTIKQIDTPDIQEIKTPSSQMVQSDESLNDNLETNSTNQVQDEENLTTTNNSNELTNLNENENSDEKLNDEIFDNNDQNEIETDDKFENVDIINSDNNSDIVNNINDNLNNESTNNEESNLENYDNNENVKDESENEINESPNENNEVTANELEEQPNEMISDNVVIENENENNTKENEENNNLEKENIEENQENIEIETDVIESNENEDEKSTIENNEETNINDEPETEETENDENNNESTNIDNDKINENDTENIVTITENENKSDENDNNNNENMENDTEHIETVTENENKPEENHNNNENENEFISDNKPDDEEESDDENSMNDSMDQLDYEGGSADGTHNTSFRSPSSPSISHDIEGFVHGEPDDNQVQSQSTEMAVDEEAKINEIIKSGDMEQLASIVLNGQGNKLLGAQSSQPEIQAFLDNVPSYMSKISRVHQAARDGNLRELQAALDRRKFAIARNEISPKGATPLHVSAIFGHSGIVRYLAGRFPETTTSVDEDGRTPLHYAATINDNGHFYNLLVHFGSNPKVTDKLGNTPEYYKDHKSTEHIFSHKQLLKSFGANETLETEMLSDQVPDDVHSARKYLDDEDVITTLERCFKLINESTLTTNSTNNNNNNSNNSVSSLRLNITTYLARFLKRSVFDKIKYRQTKLDHNLFDVIWPAMKKSSKERRIDEDLNSGVVAADYDVFVVFQEFFIPLIKDMHCLNLSQELKPHPRLFYFPLIDGEKDEFINYDIDDSNKYVSELYVECTRNLNEFELPLNLNIGQIEHAERLLIEKILTTEFAKAIGEPEAGIYYTMNEVLESPSEIRHVLENSKLMIPLLDSRESEQEAECHAINGMFWPYGRGVFISHQGDLAAWINVQDHLRIIVGAPNSQPTNIGYAYSKVGRAITFLEEKLHFRESYFLGYLSSRPSFLGAALKISSILELPNLMKEIDNLKHLCVVRGLYMIPGKEKENKCRVVNMQSLGCTEWRLFQDYCTAVSNILQLEKDMSLTNSKQIAAMLIKIFRRKKTNNND